MGSDCVVKIDDGFLNVRVGAIIVGDGKILMVRNDRHDYYYSVGGRIKFGETAEEAVIREVYEETGIRCEVERLGFIQENYFYGDDLPRMGKLIYEISFYFYMKLPEQFNPVCLSRTADGAEEKLFWVSPDDKAKIYPEFFRSALSAPQAGVVHIVNDERR